MCFVCQYFGVVRDDNDSPDDNNVLYISNGNSFNTYLWKKRPNIENVIASYLRN